MFGFIFYLIIIWIVVYNVFYRKCPPNSALVIIDKTNPSRKKLKNIITTGGAFVNPINQDFKIISFKRTKINIDLKKVLVKQFSYRVNLNMTFITGCSKSPLLLKNAALEIMDLTQLKILNQARETIENQLKLICALYTKEEIAEGKDFLNYLKKSLDSVLGAIGMEVTNIYVNSITDDSGEIKPQKQPTKKEEKTVQKPVKQSFEQEFGEITKKELQQKEEEKQKIEEAYSALFANESFEEFKKNSKQEQETTIKQELKEVIEKAVEKTEENITEQTTEQTQTSAEPSVEPSVEPSDESAPSDDVFASVRHYFENKNQ